MVIFFVKINPLNPPKTLNPRELIWKRKATRIRDHFKDKLIATTEFHWDDTTSPFRLWLKIDPSIRIFELPIRHTEIGLKFGLKPIKGAISLDYAKGAMVFSFAPL